MRRDAARLFDHALRRFGHRPAAHHHAVAAKGSDALLYRHRVAVPDRHVVHGNPHLIGDDLGERSFMPLVMGAGTRQHRDFTGALHSNRATFKARAAAGLDEGRNTDAHSSAGARASAGLRTRWRETGHRSGPMGGFSESPASFSEATPGR